MKFDKFKEISGFSETNKFIFSAKLKIIFSKKLNNIRANIFSQKRIYRYQLHMEYFCI